MGRQTGVDIVDNYRLATSITMQINLCPHRGISLPEMVVGGPLVEKITQHKHV